MENSNVLDFPLQGNLTKEKIKKAHERLLKIAVTIRDIFDENGIPYCIAFGTVLGAVRHKGFIPWDMDFDMYVEEKDYEKAMKCLKSALPDDMVLLNSSTDPNYTAFWTKVVDINSEMRATQFSGDNLFKYKGLHVDVYCLRKTKEYLFKEELLKENKDYFKRKYEKKLISEEEYNIEIERIKKEIIAERKSRNEKNVDEILYFLSLFKGSIDCIYPLKEYEFEGEKFIGPNDFDCYLKGCYYEGDYLTPPPYEKRDTKIDRLYID